MPTDAAPADELDDDEAPEPEDATPDQADAPDPEAEVVADEAHEYDPDYDLLDDEDSPFMQRAKRLRDGPTWVGLAPIGILVGTLIATVFGSVVLTLLVLFGGAAAWGVAVWRITRADASDDAPDDETVDDAPDGDSVPEPGD